VDWYKKHRDLLESPLLMIRRADGRDYDGWIHVGNKEAIATVFNPLKVEIEREIPLPLYYTGITGSAKLTVGQQSPKSVKVDSRGITTVKVKIPAGKSIDVMIRS